jgi:hypothetical protein
MRELPVTLGGVCGLSGSPSSKISCHFCCKIDLRVLTQPSQVDPELSYEKSGMPGMSVPSGRTDVAVHLSCGDVHDYERQKKGVKDTHRRENQSPQSNRNELTVLKYRSIHSLERRLEQQDSEL